MKKWDDLGGFQKRTPIFGENHPSRLGGLDVRCLGGLGWMPGFKLIVFQQPKLLQNPKEHHLTLSQTYPTHRTRHSSNLNEGLLRIT